VPNVKSAGVRELVLDRLLRNPRGYTVNELMERVNKELVFEGLRPITAGNTIRNDLTNISNRFKQPIREVTRGHAIYFSYEDPNFTIYKSQLTQRELRLIYALLQNIKYLDAWHGSIIYQELEETVRDFVQLDCYQLPFVIYENYTSDEEQRHLCMLNDCICSQMAVKITFVQNKAGPKLLTIHPYFLRQHERLWHVLGLDAATGAAVCIPLHEIKSIVCDETTDYIPNRNYNADEFFALLHLK
jgi:hypothetical protein